MERKERKRIFFIKLGAVILSSFLVVLIAFLSIRNVMFFPCEINGDSMSPTLYNNEYGLVLKKKYAKIKRGSIVVITREDASIIKRVVALPGETVTVDVSNNICINGEVLEEKYIPEDQKKQNGKGNIVFGRSYVVPEDSYYCLGDNRSVSLDSRYMGAFSYESIEGVLKYISADCKNDVCSQRSYKSPKFF